MTNKNPSDRNPQRASAELDALLHRGVLADKRATKPAIPPAPSPSSSSTANVTAPIIALERLERLTIRYTKEEAQLLEKARGFARSMGYKISDTAVFRLALNSFDPSKMTASAIQAVLAADSRRKENREHITR